MSPRYCLIVLTACTVPKDVTAVYAPAQPASGAIDVVLNHPSTTLTVAVADQLVVDRKYSRKAHIDGVPPGPAHVRVATGGHCEQGSLTEHDVMVPAGGVATIALPGPEPNLGCEVFLGLYYVGLNVGVAAMAIAMVAASQVQHVTHVK